MIYETHPRTEAMVSPWRHIKKEVRRRLTALFTKQGDPVVGQYWDDCPSRSRKTNRQMKTIEVIEGLHDMARQMNECPPPEEATHAAEILEEAADIITYDGHDGGLSLDEYQHRAIRTCTPSCYNYHYMMGNLVAEVGEASGKVAKAIRKGEGSFVDGVFTFTANADENDRLLKCELGDILWQLAGICSVQGWSLEDIADMNLRKLADRKQRGVIIGNGDER